jgi:hypothetical protein
MTDQFIVPNQPNSPRPLRLARGLPVPYTHQPRIVAAAWHTMRGRMYRNENTPAQISWAKAVFVAAVYAASAAVTAERADAETLSLTAHQLELDI